MVRILGNIFKAFLWLLLLFLIGVLGILFAIAPEFMFSKVNTVQQDLSLTVKAETKSFHANLFIADLHDDSLSWRYDITNQNDKGQSDLPRLRAGGVNLQVYSAITKSMMDPGPHNDDASVITNVQSILQLQPPQTWFSPLERALYQATKLDMFARKSQDALLVIRSSADLENLISSEIADKKIGALLSLEGLHALERDIGNFDRLYEAGYRVFGLAHCFDNAFAGSSQGVERHGLTDLGRKLIQHGDEFGIIWDVAHTSEATINDLLELTSNPVIVSHTGVRAVCDRDRNISDDQILKLAESGGLIGIGFWKGAVCDASVIAIVRSIRHVADLVGVEHVALGSDFNGGVKTPFDASGLSYLTQGLLDDGFSHEEIEAIMGGNVRRLLNEALK